MNKFANPWVARRRTPAEDEAAINAFLSKGGKVVKLKDDDGGYDKGLKKTEHRLAGGFNPFTKEDALTVPDSDPE